MKKSLSAALILGLSLLVVRPLIGAPKEGETITVRVLESRLMAEPKFLGKTVAKLPRGEHLELKAKEKAWYLIKTKAGQEGWVHKSGVVDKKITLSANPGKAGSGASQEEIELAGRGFTPEVEKEYRSKNAALDFTHIDKIEKLLVSPDKVIKFVGSGKLGGGK